MDDLVKQIIAKTGISEKDASAVINTVLNYLKDKMPAPISSQLDDVIKGGSSGIEGNVKGLDGIFGK